MDKIVSIVSLAPQTRSKNDDDFADRLSSRYTVIMLVVFAIVVSMNQYVGNPITCWAPVHFTGSHIKYANSYCWVRNTYYLPYEEEIPRPWETDKQVLPYYQWIPFILLTQAIFFYLPTVIWHGLNSKAGVDADNILESAHSLSRTENEENREKTLNLLTKQVDRFLESRKTNQKWHFDMKHILSATLCRCCGRRMGNYLVLLFLSSKLFYIGNVIMQMFVLNKILGFKFNLYGASVLGNMVADHDWTQAPIVAFPRVTMCDFNVRRLGNIHRYTVQCVLPINLYNEKIYIFLWFWMVFVAVISTLSFLIWFLRFLMGTDRTRFVRNHLKRREKNTPEKRKEREFVEDYLRQDGAFILRLISHNTNNITTTEITCALWDFWIQETENKKKRKAAKEKEREAGLTDGEDGSLPMKTYPPGGKTEEPTAPPSEEPLLHSTPPPEVEAGPLPEKEPLPPTYEGFAADKAAVDKQD